MFVLLVLVAVVITSGCVNELIYTGVREERIPLDYETRGRENPYPSLNFTIDCSRLENESQDDCREFIRNQETLVYPELERITGIDLMWCYDTINYTIYTGENIPEYGSGVEPPKGAFSSRGSSANMGYVSKVSVHSRCKMASHELTHAFDNCINMGGLSELTAVVTGGAAEKNLCPGWKIPYNLSRILQHIIPRRVLTRDRPPSFINEFLYYDCMAAQASVIYNSDEEFLHKFYERLLQEPLGLNKDGYLITEAILYASDEIDENVTRHCLDDSGQPLVLEH